MRKYLIFIPRPGVVNISSEKHDLINTGQIITVAMPYTKKNLIKQLQALGIVDNNAEVTYKVKIADTNTNVYLWKDEIILNSYNAGPGNGRDFGTDRTATSGQAMGNPGGDTISPNISQNITIKGNVGQGQIVPAADQMPKGTVPWQKPQVLAVLQIQNRVHDSPAPNTLKPMFTTQQVITAPSWNGDPGTYPQMIQISYPNTLQQTENVKNGNFAANGNVLPNGQPVPGYKVPTQYGPKIGPQYANPNPPTMEPETPYTTPLKNEEGD